MSKTANHTPGILTSFSIPSFDHSGTVSQKRLKTGSMSGRQSVPHEEAARPGWHNSMVVRRETPPVRALSETLLRLRLVRLNTTKQAERTWRQRRISPLVRSRNMLTCLVDVSLATEFLNAIHKHQQ
jgi:hypothetical protein